MSHNDDIAIKVSNVSKHFLLPHQRASSLKSSFVNPFTKFENEKQMALDGVSFEVKKGEFFGIVGRNGSGKSTLLKCMAGVYTPDKGNITVNGSLVPFIELGVGFNPELSGRDNVFLNGALLGFKRNEVEAMYEEIVNFAELEKFMDQKLKNYSSGMQVRLAFSIAIRSRGEILLLDEVLAVGDTSFQKKCFNYFEKLKDEKSTVVLVTHNMDAVERFCTKAIIIENGKIAKLGFPNEIAQLYSDVNTLSEIKPKNSKKPEDLSITDSTLVTVDLLDKQNHKTETIKPEMDITVSVTIKSNKDIDRAALGMIIYNSRKIPIFACNTKNEDIELDIKKNKELKLTYTIQNIFSNDSFSIKIGLRDLNGTKVYFLKSDIAQFASIGRRHSHAVASPAFNIIKTNI